MLILAVKDKKKFYNSTSRSKKVFLLFVVIVSVCGDNKDEDFCAVYFVHKPMLLVDASRPCTLFILAERLGDARAGSGMFLQL
jgi:hypothetical protein